MTDDLFIEQSPFAFVVDVESLTEAAKAQINSSGQMILRGVPATVIGEMNANKRMYGEKTITKAINDCKKGGLFEGKRLLCTADDHPKTSYPAPIHASHVVLDAYVKNIGGKKILLNDWQILNTTNGKNLRSLIKDGAAWGTSIRGLGKLNEETSEVENYKFLGTDAVGNPSAGTYALPSDYKVQIEAVDDDSFYKVTEGLNSMFDLDKEISEFRTKYFKDDKPPAVNPAVLSELVRLETSAVNSGSSLDKVEELKIEIFGKVVDPVVSEVSSEVDEKKRLAKAEDALNRTSRRLGAQTAMTQFLAQESKNKDEIIQAANVLVEAFQNKFTELKIELDEASQTPDISNTTSNDKIVEIVLQMREQAKTTILGLEEQLKIAILSGETISEHFRSMQFIANELAESLRSLYDARVQENFNHSRTIDSKVAERSHDIGYRAGLR